ncbi:hypothetical protein PoB_000533200 [Plakobranchus ocellatus]|uniref:Uncharacterized protein n=1 Tax=Plakobranchus ocellatus TaxID=259542 RepID=A0AAV3Y7R8_9GAST|nr:hypothetical protein PoB_000533200 [Plakobranchus ocellatus]
MRSCEHGRYQLTMWPQSATSIKVFLKARHSTSGSRDLSNPTDIKDSWMISSFPCLMTHSLTMMVSGVLDSMVLAQVEDGTRDRDVLSHFSSQIAAKVI